MPVYPRAAFRSAAALVIGFGVWFASGTGALADDPPVVAWSVSPAAADGTLDGRSRLEFQVDPGATVTDYVTIANASTSNQTFDVYGADAVNTDDGGYDLLAAATPSTDAGTWISMDQPQVSIPPLSAGAVAVTVSVPADATPGDHAAGVLVSRANPQPDAQGVVVDSRVAVRVSVRVAGELTPALTVSDVHVGYGGSLVPFGPADADVSYTVRNTGNVTVQGSPRLRITGPFGTHLANVEAQPTKEVLPGQSFTVSTVLTGVEPLLVGTAVVDVAMAAAPGPQTEIPLVSSTARATFAAVPWTGLAVLALVGLAVWWLLRWRRLRQTEREAMWSELVDYAKSGQLPQGSSATGQGTTGGGVTLVLAIGLALVGGGVTALVSAPPASAAEVPPSGQAEVRLLIPPAPLPSATATQPATNPPATGRPPRPGDGPTTAPPLADTPSDDPSDAPTPDPSRTPAPLGADTVWREPDGLTPPQWALITISGVVAAGSAGVGLRSLLRARSRAVAS